MSDPVAPGAEEPVVVNLAKTAEQETARADIMKQIFGEIGELIEGLPMVLCSKLVTNTLVHC